MNLRNFDICHENQKVTTANPVTENAMNISSTKYEISVINAAMVRETIARVQKYGSVHLMSGCFMIKGPNEKRELEV